MAGSCHVLHLAASSPGTAPHWASPVPRDTARQPAYNQLAAVTACSAKGRGQTKNNPGLTPARVL